MLAQACKVTLFFSKMYGIWIKLLLLLFKLFIGFSILCYITVSWIKLLTGKQQKKCSPNLNLSLYQRYLIHRWCMFFFVKTLKFWTEFKINLGHDYGVQRDRFMKKTRGNISRDTVHTITISEYASRFVLKYHLWMRQLISPGLHKESFQAVTASVCKVCVTKRDWPEILLDMKRKVVWETQRYVVPATGTSTLNHRRK